jgi:hypothetical protein
VLYPIAFVVLHSQALDVLANVLLLVGLGAAGVRTLAMHDSEWEPQVVLAPGSERPERAPVSVAA